MSNQERTVLQTWKQRAHVLKREVYTLYLAYRDPRTPWYGKVLAALVVAYAFSPIDLIPDFVPIFGYLDDLVLVPLGVALAMRMIPPEVKADSRAKAEEVLRAGKPISRFGMVIVGAIWIALAVLAIRLIVRLF
jgi:uncharacterized membrane protein YkvA (DUF1232 family)